MLKSVPLFAANNNNSNNDEKKLSPEEMRMRTSQRRKVRPHKPESYGRYSD